MTHKFDKEKIRLFFKFNKFSFIELIWTVIGLLCDIILFITIDGLNAPWYMLCILVFWVSLTGFGVYRVYMSFSTTYQRFDDYYKCIKIFNEHGVKESLIYSLRDLPCTSTVADELIKKYDIKNIEFFEK